MKAIVQDTYRSADMLRLEEIDEPTIGENDVLWSACTPPVSIRVCGT